MWTLGRPVEAQLDARIPIARPAWFQGEPRLVGAGSPALGRGYDHHAMFTQRSAAPAVRVAGVIKRFGATVALAGVDLEVAEGTVFGLLGPNGAGQTPLW